MWKPEEQLSPETRIWIYIADRNLNETEVEEMNSQLKLFCEEWTAHSDDLHAFGKIYNQRILVFFADETHIEASGCSIDKSVKIIKVLEDKYKLNFLDRFWIALKENNQVDFYHVKNDTELIKKRWQQNPEIEISNLTLTLKKDWETDFYQPFEKSWVARMV